MDNTRYSEPLTALEALGECGLPLHVADAVIHDLALVGWEVRRVEPTARNPRSDNNERRGYRLEHRRGE